MPRAAAVGRARTTLLLRERMTHEQGWFFHFVNLRTGAREWSSELSSIDSALFVAGALTVRQCFGRRPTSARLADAIYRRVDFAWMLAGDPAPALARMETRVGLPEIAVEPLLRADDLYLLAIGSPTHPIPPESWRAWRRPDDHVRALHLRRRPAAAVRAPGTRTRGWTSAAAASAAAEHRLVAELGDGHPRASGVLSSAWPASSPATPTGSGVSRRRTAGRATSPGADRRARHRSTGRSCRRRRQDR